MPCKEPFYEGQEIRIYCPHKLIESEPDRFIYAVIVPPDPEWPGIVIIKNDEYPGGTYCGINWIQSIPEYQREEKS